ncbi:COX assembly mitochondrial protein homolog [Chironomus tepperi]|uniref:COX assembly mitochondrial protein homolog n=1 Tax=Chironomus tepperi TaxID=113505 RepID=UPI00391EF9FD
MVLAHSDQEAEATNFPVKNVGGPRGLGDPDDRKLRKVEKEVLIPKIMRDRAKKEKCIEEVAAFEDCCKNSNVFMVLKCREQNEKLWGCLTKWYKDETFVGECTEIYLQERSDFRRTGLQKKYRDYLKNRDSNKSEE